MATAAEDDAEIVLPPEDVEIPLAVDTKPSRPVRSARYFYRLENNRLVDCPDEEAQILSTSRRPSTMRLSCRSSTTSTTTLSSRHSTRTSCPDSSLRPTTRR